MFICGGHHDRDSIAVLVMVSRADSILPIILYYVYRLVLRSVETEIQEDVSVMSRGHRAPNQQQHHDGSHCNSAIDILLVKEKQNQAPLGETWSVLPILTDNLSIASTSLCKYNTLKIQHRG